METEYVFVYCQYSPRPGQRIGQYIGKGRILTRDFILVNQSKTCVLMPVPMGSGTNIIGEVLKVSGEGLSFIRNQINQRQFELDGRAAPVQMKKILVMVDNRAIHAIVYYRTDDARLAGLPIVTSGEWDVRNGRPMPGHDPGFRRGKVMEEFTCYRCSREIPADEAIDIKGEPWCIGCSSTSSDADLNGDSAFAEDNDDEGEPEYSGDISFTLGENKIYITTDYGEMYGPFDSIMEAIEGLSDLANELEDVSCVTVGFRLTRDGIGEDAQDELDARTVPF